MRWILNKEKLMSIGYKIGGEKIVSYVNRKINFYSYFGTLWGWTSDLG